MKTGVGIYVKNSAEAVKLYMEAFGLELGYHVLNPDGSYYHSELYYEETEMFDVIEAWEEKLQDNIVQVSVVLDSEEAVKKAYGLLTIGGRIDKPIGPLPWSPLAASVFDRFGVWWYISAPQFYPGDDFDPQNS